MEELTYEIVEDNQAIRCLRCNLTSYHPEDVKQRYCAHCHLFHEDGLKARAE